jgi:hypothetical protein
VFRRRRPSLPPDPLAAVDPAAAPRRFARPVEDAVEARRRFRELIEGLRPGPTQDRLAAAGLQFDAGVLAMWNAVQRAGELERILATLDPDRVTDEYKQARRSGAAPDVLAAHEARFGSVQRLLNALDDTDERLALLDVRLGALVARAAEVALAAGAGADELDGELATLVDELGALRAGLDSLA